MGEEAPAGAAPVACTLDAGEIPGRVEEWRAVLSHVRSREALDAGVRLVLDRATPLEPLLRLVAAEQACCSFFAFSVTFDGRGMGLEVRAPAEAAGVVEQLFGSA